MVRKLRKILKLGSAFTVSIPAEYIKDMNLEKGDYVEVTKISPTEIIVRKVEIVPVQKKQRKKLWHDINKNPDISSELIQNITGKLQ